MVGVTVDVVQKSKLAEMRKRFNGLSKISVLVGIPQENSSRDNGDKINNAELVYIHTHGIRRRSMISEMDKSINGGAKYSAAYSMYVQAHGSPLWASPPRPIIEPAIEDGKDGIADELKSAIRMYVNTGNINGYHRAGMLGAGMAHEWFENPKNGWPPNSAYTIKKKGSELPLVADGDLRHAITYVVIDDNVGIRNVGGN